MRTGRMSHRDLQTFLVHLFGGGLNDERYVVEKSRSLPGGEIRPVDTPFADGQLVKADQKPRSSPSRWWNNGFARHSG